MAILTVDNSSATSRDSSPARTEQQLRAWLERGVLKVGDRLPSERELALRLDVDRNSVRWAVAVLQREGLIRAQGPRTRVVAEPISQATVSPLMQNTVVVLGTVSGKEVSEADPAHLCWSDAIEVSAKRQITRLGLHYMSINPGRFDGRLPEDLACIRPGGIIVPELHRGAQDCIRSVLALSAAGISVSAYGGDPELACVDRVTSDHEKGAYDLTRWLIEHGRRRILMMWDGPAETDYWYAARRIGYERAMREAGCSPLPTLCTPPISRHLPPVRAGFIEESRKLVGHLIDYIVPEPTIDAIACLTDGVVYLMAQAIRLCGKEPGRDIALVGYDNYGQASPDRVFFPGVLAATVDKQYAPIGEELVRLLMDRIAGRLPEAPQCRVIPPQLVVIDGL